MTCHDEIDNFIKDPSEGSGYPRPPGVIGRESKVQVPDSNTAGGDMPRHEATCRCTPVTITVRVECPPVVDAEFLAELRRSIRIRKPR